MNLHNRVALITGAARGQGKAIARLFATAGARVVVADRYQAAAQQVAEDIVAAGGQAIGLGFDASVEAQVNAVVEFTAAAWDTIDILVCNAGTQIIKPLQTFSFQEWRTIMAVHLDGAFLMTRACLPRMYAQGRGCIIYLGDETGSEAARFKAPYVTAKQGMLGLCRAVAVEGAEHGVSANVICPGFARVPCFEQSLPELARILGLDEPEAARQVELRGALDGEFACERDVAEVALMFASLDSHVLSGQTLNVSHGWSLE